MDLQSRNASLDLLKIWCMFLIVMHHFSVYSELAYNGTNFSERDLFLSIISLAGKIGVNVFMLISGYFLYSSQFSIKKLIHLELVTVFFSILFFILFVVIGDKEFSWSQLIVNLMPTTFGRYWFIKSYIFIYLLSPFINRTLRDTPKESFIGLIAILLAFGSLMPMISQLIARNGYFDNMLWLLIIYIIGAYFRKYDDDFCKCSFFLKGFLLMTLLLILGCIILYLFNLSSENKFSMSFYRDSYNLPVILVSVFLFLLFKTLNIKKMAGLISHLSSLMFGVYLIHENFYMREFLWIDSLGFLMEKSSIVFVLESIFYVVLIFFICITTEFIRTKLFFNFFDKLEIFLTIKIQFFKAKLIRILLE